MTMRGDSRMKSIETIRDEILNFDKDETFYKENSFYEACYKLTCAFEDNFLKLIKKSMLELSPDIVSPKQDSDRHSYREALKHAYKYCSKKNNDNNLSCTDTTQAAQILSNFFNFNDIRNMFEQTDLGKYHIEMATDNEISFIRNPGLRSFDAELYTRWVDNAKPELSNDIQNKPDVELFKFAFLPQYALELDMKNPILCRKTHFGKIFKKALEKMCSDSEETEDYDFIDFKTHDFKKIYAVLIALSVSHLNYHCTKRLRNGIEIHKNEPIIKLHAQELIDIILEYSGCEKQHILSVLNLLTYNPEFHKDKYTIFQPLFHMEDTYFFSPSLVYFSMAYDKLLFLAKSDDKHKKLISKLASERETIMTNGICDYIEEHTEWLYTSNYKIGKKSKQIAEFDIIIYDNISNKLLLVELKWFFKFDGEAGSKKVDDKLKKFITDRKLKEQYAQTHLSDIMRELDVEDYNKDSIEILSCLISKNYSGSDFINDEIAVFDDFWFKEFIKQNQFNLPLIFEKIKDKTYIPDMSSIPIVYIPQSAKYAGYKINFEQLYMKT